MNQCQSAVCFESSDEEDVIEFDAEELNTGIANLVTLFIIHTINTLTNNKKKQYDEESASDYGGDSSEEDLEDEEDEELFVEKALKSHPRAQGQPPPQQQQVEDLLGFGMMNELN